MADRKENDIVEDIDHLHRHGQQLQRHCVEGSLMLVDLADSTAYKTANPERIWLPRLFDFRNSVEDAIDPAKPTKYLGDGILLFAKTDEIGICKFLEFARQIYLNIAEKNKNYPGEHAIVARIVLNYGSVFLFDGDDPQGSAVDKVFRIEKYIPNGCIGMSTEFKDRAKIDDVKSIGCYRLKGLTRGLHEIFLVNRCDGKAPAMLDELGKQAALRDFWDLGIHGTGKITIITGCIPPETDGADTIEMGDKDALVNAVVNVAKVGRIHNLNVLTCQETREEDLRENIVCVGGPYYNSVTLKLLQEIQSPFVFDLTDTESDKTPIRRCDAIGGSFDSHRNERGRLIHDWGFLGRFRNPFNNNTHVILACGIETSGVFGIVKAFGSQNPHLQDLHQAVRKQSVDRSDLVDFFCLMKFGVERTGMPTLPPCEDQLGGIVSDWLGSHNRLIQKALKP